MGIRHAEITDWQNIRDLLKQLGYFDTDEFLKDNIKRLAGYPFNASDPNILLFPPTICRYGTDAVVDACCISR
jgi:hypothetical protein